MWLSPGAWGIVNALILGTSRYDEAKEFLSHKALHSICCCCDSEDEEEEEYSVDSEADRGTSSSFPHFVIFRPSMNQVKIFEPDKKKKKKKYRSSEFIRDSALDACDEENISSENPLNTVPAVPPDSTSEN